MTVDFRPGVTLITCTGDRPKAFERCVQFVNRQTYQGPLQWIVVDDGKDMTQVPKGVMRTRLSPLPSWKPGQNTLARNLLAAIPKVHYDKVLFIEDDDQYAADYVEQMATYLSDGSIVGDPLSRYYHLPSKRWRLMKNLGTASLCQTGIRAEMLAMLAAACKESADFIDARLWQMPQRRLLLNVGRCVGMKGLPGRPGIGVGHRPDTRRGEWTDDKDLSVLREWIGDDVEMYREFL